MAVARGPYRPRRTAAEKAAIVANAEVVGLRRAAKRAHVPPSTLVTWRKEPAFARLRTEKQEEVAADMWAAFQVGLQRVVELMPETDDVQKAATAAAIIFDKLALMRGEATSRVETRDLDMDDHEKAQLHALLKEAVDDAVGA